MGPDGWNRVENGGGLSLDGPVTHECQVLIEKQNGYFYICGSTSMGKDVQNLLKEILGEDGFKKLETEKRLIKELW